MFGWKTLQCNFVTFNINIVSEVMGREKLTKYIPIIEDVCSGSRI